MQGDDRYYDKSCCWLLVSEAHGKDVRSLQLESAGFSPDECGDTDSEGDSDTDADDEADNCMDRQYGGAPAGNASEVKMPDPQRSVSKPNSRGKLRSASDVMHRLRWDAAIDAGDYMVGYEDRFTGAREKPLVQWKSEQTDEEFIPQHRILYFRCRSTGDIVWEHRTRTDHVFGSGTSLHEGT